MDNTKSQANEETKVAWNEVARLWDERMGEEGNDFHRYLVWPATERLLTLKDNARVLDVACGTGLTSKRLAAKGAEVLAIDFSQEMIARAKARTTTEPGRVEYQVLDATDERALSKLENRTFDAAICAMGLMDIADIKPLMRCLSKVLSPSGHFVFTVMHPCFNSMHVKMTAEFEDREGQFVTEYALKISNYLDSTIRPGLAFAAQTKPHFFFHRPLHVLLKEAFEAGFVLNGMEEPSFPPEYVSKGSSLSWGENFNSFPPVLAGRLQLIKP
jgi:2-polyprenyl-3-methyl-5-hydroxy-6-metoxy-1,4-benzoquinol methylase